MFIFSRSIESRYDKTIENHECCRYSCENTLIRQLKIICIVKIPTKIKVAFFLDCCRKLIWMNLFPVPPLNFPLPSIKPSLLYKIFLCFYFCEKNMLDSTITLWLKLLMKKINHNLRFHLKIQLMKNMLEGFNSWSNL